MELGRTESCAAGSRMEERYPFLKTVRYICMPEIDEDLKGVTIDVSRSGACMYVFSAQCIPVGCRVSINDHLPLVSHTGTVRWVRQIAPDLYKTGLQFS